MTPEPAIRELSLILTAQCNSRCRYCYQTARNGRRMDWETLRNAIDLYLRLNPGNGSVVFLGGEPLLEFASIRRAVDYLCRKKRGDGFVQYHVSTNGLLINEEVAAFLEANRFHVQLSFDGIEQAQDLRSPGTFSRIDALLGRLSRHHANLYTRSFRVGITLIPAGVAYLSDSVRHLIKRRVRQIAISPSLLHHPEWSADRAARLDREFAAIFDLSLGLFRRTGDVPVLFLRKPAGEAKPVPTRAMCALADGRRLTVDVDGRICGCAMLAESYQDLSGGLFRSALPPLRLGHLGDRGLMERLRSFPAAVSRSRLFHHRLRKYSSYGRCAECEHVGTCMVCPASIARDPDNTDPNRIPDFLCSFNRTALKYRSRFPAMPHPGRAVSS